MWDKISNWWNDERNIEKQQNKEEIYLWITKLTSGNLETFTLSLKNGYKDV